MYKKTCLDNGLRVITCRMPRMQSVALGIWINVGGRYEDKDNKGIAHFLEHLAFKGSKKYSCRKLKESIEGVGGSLNGFTSEELTCYLAKLPAAYLDLTLDILSDIVINPTMAPDEIDKERTVILEEIKMYKDLPQSYVYELLDELLWPEHPLGMSVLGSVESISGIKRDDLCLYNKQYYTSCNIVVSVAGVLQHQRLVERVNKIFFPLKDKTINKFFAAKELQNRPQLKIFTKDTEQTHLALGFHSFRRDHPLRYAVGLLHIILGANMSSRLFNELREKRGLAYEIGTQLKRFQDTGAFIVHAGIDNGKVLEAIELILKELKKVKDKPPGANEFKRAKEFYLGQLRLALEDTLDQMLWIGESTATLDRVYTLDEIIKVVNKVKVQDLQEVSKCLFKETKLNLALIGPLKDRQDEIYNRLSLA